MIHFISSNHNAHYQLDQQITRLKKMFLRYVNSDSRAVTEDPINFPTREEAQHNVNTRLISLFDNDNTQQDYGCNKVDTPNQDRD